MQYDLDIENVNTIRRRLHFTLPGSEVKGELDRAFQDLKRRVRLPGFRPGKVPRQLLEARFGRQVKGEVSGRLIDRAWRQAAREFDLAGQPALEESSDLTADQGFNFTIGVDVKPEVEISDYTGLPVEYSAAAVTDEQVERAVSNRLAAQARIQEVSDRPIQEGDFVLTELKLEKDGEELANEAGTMISTRGERYYPGIEAILEGMSVGDEKTGTATIGEGSAYEHLRGQEVQATVKILGIQARVVPELSDETAKELGFEGGAEGMQAAIRMQLEEGAQEAGRNDARVKLLQKLVDANEFDVPEAMIEEQLEALQEELKVRRAYGGEDPRKIRFSDAELADLRQRARFAAKASIILAAIARQETLDVSDEDLDGKINEIASLRQQAPAAIRGYLEREGAMPVLKARILEEKTLEWLLENAELKVVEAPAAGEAEVSEVEGRAFDQEPPAGDETSAEESRTFDDAPAQDEGAQAEAASWNKSMKKAELLEIAQARGLDVNTKSKKDEIIAALEASDQG